MIPTQQCTRCGANKPFSCYTKGKTANGLSHYCIQCQAELRGNKPKISSKTATRIDGVGYAGIALHQPTTQPPQDPEFVAAERARYDRELDEIEAELEQAKRDRRCAGQRKRHGIT